MTHYRWDDMPREELMPGLGRRFLHGERAMLAHVYLDKGVVVPTHTHESEQITYVLNGALRLWVGDAPAVDVRSGEVLVIPSNAPHRAEALEDTLDVDIFSPPRQDWIEKDDAYLRGGTR